MRIPSPRGFLNLLLLLGTGLLCVMSLDAAQPRRVLLHLRATGSFDPVFQTPRIPPDESPAVAAAGPRRGEGHYIVQFDGPVQDLWTIPIRLLGGQVFDYLPDYGFAIRIANNEVRELRRAAHVRSVTAYHPHFAISPDLPRRGQDLIPVSIRTFLPEDMAAVALRVQALRGVVEGTFSSDRGYIDARLTPAAARRVAREFGVSWVGPRDRAVLTNDRATIIGNVDDMRTSVHLYGANQTIGVFDTGLDTGIPATIHQDFAGRILNLREYNDRNAFSDPNAHGTHVAGSVLGTGLLSGADPTLQNYPTSGTPPSYTGMAPEARLVFQSHYNADGSLAAADPTSFNGVLQDAYDDGARIHSNSWGASSDSSYSTTSAAVDAFIFNHPDMTVFFSAGNSGVDSNADGFVDLGSRRAPGTAKNTITVGASENDRPSLLATWGSGYGAPIAGDRQANNPNGMAAFSSRGPCADTVGPNGETRIKPDVTTPGTSVASPRTSLIYRANEGFDSTAVGGIPAGWVETAGSPWAVTADDSFAGGRCMGFGDFNTTYPGGVDNFQFLEMPQTDMRTASVVFVICRVKYNLRPGDQMIFATDGFTFGDAVTGNSGGNWVYRIGRAPASATATGRVQFVLDRNLDNSAGTFFFQVDEVRLVPGLDGTLGEVGTETPESARDLAYLYSSGTSMACPIAAGMGAVTRQYYQEVANHFTPSAALIKATLIGSAFNMAPGQYAAPQEIATNRPGPQQGFGRLDLQKALAPQTTSFPSTLLRFWESTSGLSTSEEDSYVLNFDTGTPVNIALVWTDPPGTPAASVALVNDLDLDVSGPGGFTANGNGIAGALVNGDRRNNAEIVDIVSGLTTGTYTVTVKGFSTPLGPQPYALVIYGDTTIAAALQVTPDTAQVPLSGAQQFVALFDGRPTTGVTWSVVSGGGTIDSSGLYSAPGAGANATIRATFGALTSDAAITFAGSAAGRAHAEIQHTFPDDVTTILVGHGPTGAPDFVTANQPGNNGTDGGTGLNAYIRRDFDLALAPAGSLQPTAASQWFLRLDDTVGGDSGEVRVFFIDYNGRRYHANGLPVAVPDLALTHAIISPIAPTVNITAPADGASGLSGNQTFSATGSASLRRVEFYCDDRLLAVDTSSPFSITWNTALESNGQHRMHTVGADYLGNTASHQILVGVNNAGARPNVGMSVGNWSFNSGTRVLTATANFVNSGTQKAWKVTLQRLTLFGTGPTFSGQKPIYMQPATGVPFPRNVGDLDPAAGTTLAVSIVVPPEVTSIPRWTSAGYYFDAAVGGNRFFL